MHQMTHAINHVNHVCEAFRPSMRNWPNMNPQKMFIWIKNVTLFIKSNVLTGSWCLLPSFSIIITMKIFLAKMDTFGIPQLCYWTTCCEWLRAREGARVIGVCILEGIGVFTRTSNNAKAMCPLVGGSIWLHVCLYQHSQPWQLPPHDSQLIHSNLPNIVRKSLESSPPSPLVGQI